MTVEIKFRTTTWSATFGSFSSGDLLRCSEAAARHFVIDALAADYVAPILADAEALPGADVPAEVGDSALEGVAAEPELDAQVDLVLDVEPDSDAAPAAAEG